MTKIILFVSISLIFSPSLYGVKESDVRSIAVTVGDQIDELFVDLGEMPSNEKLDVKLELQNDTLGDLGIEKIVSSCGCVKAKLAQGNAAKGKSIWVDLEIRPRDTGSFKQIIVLKSGGGVSDIAVLLKGEAKSRIDISPIDRSACRSNGKFTTKIALNFNANLEGAKLVQDSFSEFDLILNRCGDEFVLSGTARSDIESWPKSGFSENVTFKMPDGSLLSSQFAVQQTFAEMIVPARLNVSSNVLRLSLLSPLAADSSFGRSLQVLDGRREVVAIGKESRRSKNLITYDLQFIKSFNRGDELLGFVVEVEVTESQLIWKAVGSVELVIKE